MPPGHTAPPPSSLTTTAATVHREGRYRVVRAMSLPLNALAQFMQRLSRSACCTLPRSIDILRDRWPISSQPFLLPPRRKAMEEVIVERALRWAATAGGGASQFFSKRWPSTSALPSEHCARTDGRTPSQLPDLVRLLPNSTFGDIPLSAPKAIPRTGRI